MADPSVLGMELAILGRQVQTALGGKLDILALDREANAVVLELKRGRTPREVIAQLLDSGSWVRDLAYADLNRISQEWLGKSLPAGPALTRYTGDVEFEWNAGEEAQT